GLRPTTVGLGTMIRRRPRAFPVIAVFPQCESLRGRILTKWNAGTPDGERALKILEDVESRYSVDPRRRILTGWSMGGFGVWSLAAKTAKRWAAVVPLAGGGAAKSAKRLRNTRIWAFHGANDRLVLADTTRTMVQAVQEAGGRPQFTLVKNIGHDVWKVAYSYPPLLEWLKDPRKPPPAIPELTATAEQLAIAPNDNLVPFVPAVEVSRAITLRLGNDALKAVSYSVPAMVPPTMLSGSIKDIFDSTTVEGRRFSVRFSSIRYSASLSRVRLLGAGKDRMRIQLGLSNVTMSIGATYVTGRRRSAAAGPIGVVIGYRRPVWLTIDTAPYVAARKLRLRVVSKSFRIPRDNWYVTAPSGVSVSGFGMTRRRVSSGLVSGLYGSKTRIENEVMAMAPTIVREFEKKLELPDASGMIAEFWPLPVYRPRVRIWPETVRVDDKGLTVQLGMTAAAIDPSNAPRRPRKVTAAKTVPEALESGTELHVGIAPGVLGALSQLLIEGDVGRINVLDIPSAKIAAFADHKAMTEILPDLKRFGEEVELSAELVLREPITLNSADSKLHMPAAAIVVSIRPISSASSGWKPYAEFSIGMTQPFKIDVERSGFTGRQVKADWSSKPVVTVEGRFVKGARPANAKIDAKAAARLFSDGWKSWTESLGTQRTPVSDIAFASSALRLSTIALGESQVIATFTSPGIKISNKSNQTLIYETKGPYSGWGGPYTLKPGDHHEFEVPYAMLYRRKIGNAYRLFTLPAGSHSEFRKPRGGGEPTLLKGE
ncbi:MAG: hypothetical protein ACE5KM_12700, partial [Planctomycetaceae bacterium]